MKARDSIGVKVFGIAALAWGLWILLRLVLYVAGGQLAALLPSTEESALVIWTMSLGLISFPLYLATCFIASGVGLLKSKCWARYHLLTATAVIVLVLVGRLIFLGPCTEGIRYTVAFATAALVIWYFNRKSIRLEFPHGRSLKVSGILWIITVSSILIWATASWYREGGHKSPRLQKVAYEPRNEVFYSEDYLWTPFPVGYTLAVPKGFVVASLHKDEENGVSVCLTDPRKGGIIDIYSQGRLGFMLSIAEIVGYSSNSYRSTRKVFAERYGLMLRLPRKFIMSLGDDGQFEEAQIGKIRAFIAKSFGERAWIEYYLFQGREHMGGGTIVSCTEGGSLSQEQINEILSSIKPQDQPIKSDMEYLAEGLALFGAGDVEAAKFRFASALCLDWENPEYHYHMAEAFLETDRVRSAWDHLNKGVSLQRDHPAAQELFDRIRAAEWK